MLHTVELCITSDPYGHTDTVVLATTKDPSTLKLFAETYLDIATGKDLHGYVEKDYDTIGPFNNRHYDMLAYVKDQFGFGDDVSVEKPTVYSRVY